MVVVNGSLIPKVISWLWLDGSGTLASSSSRWFCQKQRASATPKTAIETTTPKAQLVQVLDEAQLILV